MRVQQVFLVRHGETDYNVQRRWQGILPIGLNNTGRSQAQALADHFQARNIPIGEVYCSDLPRALETAQIIARPYELDVQLDERLREINVGIFQGLIGNEVSEKYPKEFAAWKTGDMDYVVPQGESRFQLQQRVGSAYFEIIEKANSENVVIVSHGGTLRFLLRRLFESDSSGFPNTSLTTIAYDDLSWRLVEVAATPHLI